MRVRAPKYIWLVLLMATSCGDPKTDNTSLTELLETEDHLKNLIEEGYTPVDDSDTGLSALNVFNRLESYYLTSGMLPEATKSGYSVFFHQFVFTDVTVNTNCIRTLIPELSSFELISPAKTWSSIEVFETLSEKEKAKPKSSSQFRNLSIALNEFYIDYNNAASDDELLTSFDKLLAKYKEDRFMADISYRVFFIHLAFVSLDFRSS